LNLKTWAIAQGLLMFIEHANRKGMVDSLAQDIDEIADKHLGGKSEHIQEKLVTLILLPLSAKLMEEDLARFNTILERTQYEIAGEFDDKRGIEPRNNRGMLGQRSNISPKRRS
jgi:hypothetical protein